MGRRKNNPELVEELIDEIWTMPQDEWGSKYNTLSSHDMGEVGHWVGEMDKQMDRSLANGSLW